MLPVSDMAPGCCVTEIMGGGRVLLTLARCHLVTFVSADHRLSHGGHFCHPFCRVTIYSLLIAMSLLTMWPLVLV